MITGAALATDREAKPRKLPRLGTATGMMSTASSKIPAAADLRETISPVSSQQLCSASNVHRKTAPSG